MKRHLLSQIRKIENRKKKIEKSSPQRVFNENGKFF